MILNIVDAQCHRQCGLHLRATFARAREQTHRFRDPLDSAKVLGLPAHRVPNVVFIEVPRNSENLAVGSTQNGRQLVRAGTSLAHSSISPSAKRSDSRSSRMLWAFARFVALRSLSPKATTRFGSAPRAL